MVTTAGQRTLAGTFGPLAERLRTLRGDRAGAAAVEFAILLPVMLLLYVGGVEIGDGYAIKRKVAGVTGALGDLVTRSKTISIKEMSNILDAAGAVIAPYDGDVLRVKVSGVWIDDKSVARVVWSVARNDTAEKKDAVISIPAGVNYKETFLVVSEAHYPYKPAIGYVISGDVDLANATYQRPRLSKTVCYNGVCEPG